VEIIRITSEQDRYTVREQLRRSKERRVLLVLPWDVERGWRLPLDYVVLRAAVQEEQLNVAWVVEDFEKRALPKEAGFPVFPSVAAAERYLETHDDWPPVDGAPRPEPRQRPEWAETPEAPALPVSVSHPLWLTALRLLVLGGVLFLVGAVFFLIVPSAKIRLVPQQATYSVIVPVSVDPELETVDLQQNMIPSRRVGDEFSSFAEIGTTGMSFSFAGRATGQVVFTNQLGQDYQVPKGTIVRTSAGSYPVRFETTEAVTVPAFGQAPAPVEALEEGPRGNVGAFQINFVEGVVGFALKVTNPDPITGAESQEVAAVAREDRERVWDLAAERVLAEAYNGLQSEGYLEQGEFLLRQSLVIQSVPMEAYTAQVGERTNALGLTLRLLVSGQAVSASDIQKVAYRRLLTQVPEGYRLTDARFEIGESAEEDVGPGRYAFFVTAHGYATAEISTNAVQEAVRGLRIEKAETYLSEELPLAAPPEVEVSPTWFPFLPRLPMRMSITVVPGRWE
jgi:hypothetical protein